MKKLNVKLPQGGSKRALHSGMYASALAVVVLAVIILVNLVIRALPTKYTEYDISTTSLFTLSDTTENLLHELNADVTAYYLPRAGRRTRTLPACWTLRGREQPFQLAAARPRALPDVRPAV